MLDQCCDTHQLAPDTWRFWVAFRRQIPVSLWAPSNHTVHVSAVQEQRGVESGETHILEQEAIIDLEVSKVQQLRSLHQLI